MRQLKIIFLLLLAAMLLTSCFESDSSDNNDTSGFLRLVNDTNASIIVTFTADGSIYTVNANSMMTFEFGMRSSVTDPKGINTTYTCEGLYFHYSTFTDEVIAGHTTARILDADRGCIRFNNNTASDVFLTIPGLSNPITIGANSNYTQAWLLTDDSATATFSFYGNYVFSDSDDMVVTVNSTGTYTINATGAAIRVINNSNHYINEVYLSPSTDLTWGSNDLIGSISPGSYVTWTVAQNTWDVKVVDSSGAYATWTSNPYISYNQMLVVDYSPSKNPKNLSRKAEGMGSTHDGQFRIQQNQMMNSLIQ